MLGLIGLIHLRNRLRSSHHSEDNADEIRRLVGHKVDLLLSVRNHISDQRGGEVCRAPSGGGSYQKLATD